jgi:pimeloyl-ACP methyl ester carboxylesterase
VPVIIGGISLGAAISLRLAVKRPDLVRALVLARPAWLTASAPENMIPNAEVGHLLTHLPPPAAKAAFLAGPLGQRLAAAAPDNLASLTGFFAREPIEVTAALLSSIPSPTRVRWRRKSPLHASSRSPPRRRTRRDTSPISTAPCARS